MSESRDSTHDPEDAWLIGHSVQLGLVTVGDLYAALEAREQAGNKSLGEVFVEQGILAPEQLEDLTRRLGTPTGPGVSLGRYAIDRPLGAGGMGEVLCVRDNDLGREIAAKVATGPLDESRLRRFVLEAQVTGQLEHPSIMPVHELGRTPEGTLYFTMKRVVGQDLAWLIHELRAGTRDDSLVSLLQTFGKVCDAVAFAHSRGIIHRDLKPANIMIGEFGEVLVCDWGLAKLVGRADIASRSLTPDEGASRSGPLLTLEGAVIGTPAYMPPEQAAGQVDRIDERADIYALGAILYELLTLEAPYDGSSAWDVLAKVLEGQPLPPRERAPARGVPWELDAVALKAMTPELDGRYPDVGALKADIDAFLGGRVLDAASYSPWQVGLKWVRRNRALVSAAAVVTLVVAGFLGYQQLQARLRTREVVAAANEATRAALEELPAGVAARLASGAGPLEEESDSQREEREAAVATCWDAASALDLALRARPNDPDLVRSRADVARRLGRLALLGRDYTVARRAFGDLAALGMDDTEVQALIASVETTRTAVLDHRRTRLESVLATLRGGLSIQRQGPGARWMEDYVLEAVAFRDAQTVRLLSDALTPFVREAAARDRNAIVWKQPARDVVTFACRVLGRLRREDAVEPLAAWMAVVRDQQLAAVAGRALCNTRSVRAHPVLIAARGRLGPDSGAWLGILPFFERVPEPEGDAPTSAEALLARGLTRFDAGKIDDAIADFSAAISARPKWAVPYGRRGETLRHRGDLDAAAVDLDTAIRLDPADAAPRRSRAWVAIARRDYEQAIADATQALRLAPDQAEGYLTRGAAHHAQGDREAAIADYTRARGRAPGNADIAQRRGQAHLELQRYPQAIADLNAALLIDPQRPLALVYRSGAKLSTGDTDGALRDAGGAVSLAPDLGMAYFARGRAYHTLKRPAQAIADFTKCLALRPGDGQALANRGASRVNAKDLDGAWKDAHAALESNAGSSLPHIVIGKVHWRRGQVEKALASMDRAIKIAPRSSQAHFERGRIQYERKQLTEALADLDRAILLDPAKPYYHGYRAGVHVQRKAPDAAITDASKEIARNPRWLLPYLHRANARHLKGDHSGAISDLDAAIVITPGWAELHYNLGNIYLDTRRYAKATLSYDRAVVLDPTHKLAHYNRALAHDRGGKRELAVRDMQTLVTLEQNNWKYWGWLGELLARLGRKAEAVTAFRKTLVMCPPSARAAVQHWLKKLGK